MLNYLKKDLFLIIILGVVIIVGMLMLSYFEGSSAFIQGYAQNLF